MHHIEIDLWLGPVLILDIALPRFYSSPVII
jgi:hypothetical protein